MHEATLQSDSTNPLSDCIAIKVKAFAKGYHIDRFVLKNFAFEDAKKAIIDIHPDWSNASVLNPESLKNLAELNSLYDFEYCLESLVFKFLHNEILQKNAISLFEEISKDSEDSSVDEKVSVGGKTLLHLASEKGDLIEVKRLIEVKKASVKVKDNSGRNALDLARLYGRKAVAEYLQNF